MEKSSNVVGMTKIFPHLSKTLPTGEKLSGARDTENFPKGMIWKNNKVCDLWKNYRNVVGGRLETVFKT